jgi:UDP-2-acetamido-2,6-beta-L-arabino-hexul-4-ose reductase
VKSLGLTKVLITGSNGFIGKNLALRMKEEGKYEILTFARGDSDQHLSNMLLNADLVVHLAGENRPESPDLFALVNTGLTLKISQILTSNGIRVPIIFVSSAQATKSNAYGQSKLEAENVLKKLSENNGNPVSTFRLPGVFGKWCRPEYNSVVATFCHNIANDLPIHVSNKNAILSLLHIDNVVESMLGAINERRAGFNYISVDNEFQITLGDLANQIRSFKECRSSLVIGKVGVGLIRALYSTYVSYLPPVDFSYSIPSHHDKRGVFVEMLKTKNSGQFSFFTAKPKTTRGGHYHHSKTEKFLVAKGNARFNFRHILSNETHTIETSGDHPEIVETVPGWAHDISNIGDDDLVVMLWANEIFDRDSPDTIFSGV